MDKIPDSIIHLDKVLYRICVSPFRYKGMTYEDIQSEAKRIFQNDYELRQIIEKLKKDGYIIHDMTLNLYSISLLGEYHVLLDGYLGEIKRLKERDTLETELKKNQGATNKSLIRLTRWIAGATIAAGIYYILEILRVQYHRGLPCHVFFQ